MTALTLPTGLLEAEALLSAMDDCLALGFSRLGGEQLEGLAQLARTFTGTPLAERLKAAVEGLARAEFREEHFLTLAAARQALQGAQYDALTDIACGVSALTRQPAAAVAPAPPQGPVATWLASTRQWLMELALAGFMQVEQETVLPFIATLDQLQQKEEAARQAMLLSGMVHELLDAIPVGAMPRVPLRRWSDLWARAMVSSLQVSSHPEAEKVSGDLCLLGVDLRHHSHAISAVFHGILSPSAGESGPERHVRLTASAYKVDVLDDEEVWQVLETARFDKLIEAYTRQKSLHLSNMLLLPSGDLLWDPGKVEISKGYELFTMARKLAAGGAVLSDVAPIDRHPVQVAVPFFSDDFTVKNEKERGLVMKSGELEVELDMVRVPESSDLSGTAMLSATKCFGLLRFDAQRWWLQPLAALGKGPKPLLTGSNASLNIKRGGTLSTLKERSGKLLRAKS